MLCFCLPSGTTGIDDGDDGDAGGHGVDGGTSIGEVSRNISGPHDACLPGIDLQI